MQSIQSRILYQMIRWWRRRSRGLKSGLNNPIAVRKVLAKGARRVRVASDIHVEPASFGALTGEWVTAPGSRGDRALLYLHGGGYVGGSPASHRALTAALSRAARVRVFALDYRLAPEHPYPAALDDAVSAYHWLLGQGLSASSIGLGGDSAGGGLTAATLVRLRDEGAPLPAAAFMLSPWADLEVTGESARTRAARDPMLVGDLAAFARHYIGDAGHPRHPRISPIHAELHDLPPLLIQVGTHEVLFDDAVRLADRVRQHRGRVELEVWDDMIHVFQIFPNFLPEARRAIARIAAFLQAELR